MAIIDIFSYNGESDLLELRLNALGDVVDEFIICEARSTFSGLPKPLYFTEQRLWREKITYHVIDEEYTEEEVEQARNSPYTGGIERWMREYMQKESLKKALTHLDDEDIVYVGDVDELWEPREYVGIEKLKLRVYAYWLNFRSTEEFWGTIRCKYKDIKGQCLNDVRNDLSYRTTDYQGWHFTNMGGMEALKKKITDQYNQEVFNSTLIHELMPQNYGIRDFIGRDFDFETDESEWPEYLKINKESYKNLCKQS